MTRLIFLLEEYSMKVFLEGILPRLFPTLAFLCIPHEGKQNLEQSISRKLRAWRTPGDRFLVLRDNDGAECSALKARLVDRCREGRREDTVVRLACQELEAFYLGDPEALAQTLGDHSLRGLENRARYRDPDTVSNPSAALRELIPEFQKVSGARRMARSMVRERNRSSSFHALLTGIEKLCSETSG
ncbi:MAG: DUF4276 family protein [Planctomycetes bacterium]|nr:DUF4276 family protein [Planctomycetota bacterium]